jgi:hypothetical protein
MQEEEIRSACMLNPFAAFAMLFIAFATSIICSLVGSSVSRLLINYVLTTQNFRELKEFATWKSRR